MRAFWLTSYEAEIQRELLGLGHHNLGALIPTGVVLTVLVYLATRAQAPAAGMVAWLACSVAARLLCAWLWWRFRPLARAEQPEPGAVRRWMWAHGIVMVLLGGSVGLLGALYVPVDQAAGSPSAAMQNLFLTMAFLGATAYSAVGNATHDLPAFLLSLLCAAVVMLIQVPAAYGSHALPVAGLCLVFCTLMVAMGLRAHRQLIANIRLRLSNQRLAAEQAQAAAAAQKANRDKSEFLAAASHDLRQPVHALLLLVESLKRSGERSRAEGAAPTEADALVASIGEAAQAIGAQFNGLMELSRLESGHQPVVPAPIDLGALLRQCIDRHAAELVPGHPVRLGLRIGRRAQGVWLNTDRLLLERIVANLLGNALRYTRQGRVMVTLRQGPGDDLRLSVHDSGIGISPDELSRIFEPYVQLGNAQRDRRQGLGLGLAIANQCAQRLGLGIGVASRVGRGSCFQLRLPAALRCAPASTRAAAPGEPAPEGALAHRRVLLIDDDPMVRGAMAGLLQSWRVDLRIARDGADPAIGQCLAEGWQPELLLCDQRLPGATQGLELLDQLHGHWPAAAALLQTGEPPERVGLAAEAAGYPVLYKPVSANQLARTLRALLPNPARPAPAAPTASGTPVAPLAPTP